MRFPGMAESKLAFIRRLKHVCAPLKRKEHIHYGSGFWLWLFLVNSWSQAMENVNGGVKYTLANSSQNGSHEIKGFSRNRNENMGLSGMKSIGPHNRLHKLNVSHAMAATGARLWCGGIAMQAIGMGLVISGYIHPFEKSHKMAVYGLFLGGITLDFLGPIPAFLGEKHAKNKVNQMDNNPLGKKSGITSSRYYGLSWLLCSGSLIAWTTMNTDYPGFGFTFASGTYIAALILRGFAAISPSRRILHFKNGLSLHPHSDLRDNIGLAVNYVF